MMRLRGSSDKWVTAYTATAIASLETDRSRPAAFNAWKLLKNRRQPGEGWGYNDRLPVDMDVTAWLRIPSSLVIAPDENTGEMSFFLDNRGIFTSATVVHALEAARRHLKP